MLLSLTVVAPPETDLMAKLRALPHVVDVQPGARESFDVSFEQPVDHFFVADQRDPVPRPALLAQLGDGVE